MNFVLNSQLELDSEFVCNLSLSQVRLSNNASFPWIMLVPQRVDMVELIDLSIEEQIQLLEEIREASLVMQKLLKPDKLNVAIIGNIVSQLHIHVIARFHNDAAWPNPVWNSGIKSQYSNDDKQAVIFMLKNAFRVSV